VKERMKERVMFYSKVENNNENPNEAQKLNSKHHFNIEKLK
jgi:hypothetical protein